MVVSASLGFSLTHDNDNAAIPEGMSPTHVHVNRGVDRLADEGAQSHNVPQDILEQAKWRMQYAVGIQKFGIDLQRARVSTLPLPHRRQDLSAEQLASRQRGWQENFTFVHCDPVLQEALDAIEAFHDEHDEVEE